MTRKAPMSGMIPKTTKNEEMEKLDKEKTKFTQVTRMHYQAEMNTQHKQEIQKPRSVRTPTQYLEGKIQGKVLSASR